MSARHNPSRSHEGYPSPSPPADMNDPFNPRHYYDNDVEQSEVYHRDNYGSESSAAGLNDYDHPDPYGSSSPSSHSHLNLTTRDYRPTRHRLGPRCLWPALRSFRRVSQRWALLGTESRRLWRISV